MELPIEQVAILRDELAGWVAGIGEDLATAGVLPDGGASAREAEAFRRLFVALDTGEIALPDEEARAALAKAAEGYEEPAGFDRAVAVHDAHHALLGVLDREAGR